MSAIAQPWGKAYRPLRGRTLLLQLAVLAVAEILLFHSYRNHDADFHWAAHFLVGLTAAALWNLVWLAVKGAPARGLLISVLIAHLFAMAPDLIFNAGVPHEPWMNVFLGHIWVHYIPGQDTSLLVIALLASGAFAGCLAAWLQARTIEADAGLAPGIGIGGAALVRPQRNPHTTPLAHVRYGPDDRPPDLILLHGLAASHQIWEPVAHDLAERELSVLVPDLLGFGGSRAIGTSFHLDDHVDAVRRLLDQHEVEQILVVGHSFGCAVSAALVAADPRVRALVLVSPPVFRDGAEARERLSQRGWLARKVVYGSPLASFACELMCLLRPLAARAIPRVEPRLPRAVARDGVQHTWPAYRDALGALLEDNPLPALLAAPPRPTTIVVGDHDDETPPADVLDYPHERVEVVVLPGDHLLPYFAAAEVAAIIATC